MGIGLVGLADSDSRRLEPLTRFTYTEYHMGVDARLVVYAPTEKVAQDACRAAFERMAQLDTMMSDYRVDSELNKLCAKSGGPAVHVSPEMFLVLQRAVEVSRRSHGAFDVTVGPLVRLWRAARKSAVLPTVAEIANARAHVGWQHIYLDKSTGYVRLDTPGMKLDFGGIAKGYADDEAQRVLKEHGVDRALVEMGGDIVVSDPPPGEKGWKIEVPNAVARPSRSRVSPTVPVGRREIPFQNCAVSSSGDTEQFVVIGGRRYSHIVDPRTGWALTTRVQVTVIAKDGLTSDPLTKAVTMLSEAPRRKFLRFYPGVKTFARVIRGA